MTHFKTVFLNKLGGIFPVPCSWCRRPATHLLTRIDAEQNKYEDTVCDTHARDWEKYRQGVQIEMEGIE